MLTKIKEIRRISRHKRITRKVIGTNDRPRLYVYRSLNNMHAQVVDDISGRVLFGISTLDKELRKKLKNRGNINAATLLGQALALKAKGKGITRICFDRGGYLYHGRVKAFAEAARKGGLEF